MPRIDRTCLTTMNSPVRFLIKKSLGDSVFSIAPERKREFMVSLNNFDLIFTNARPWQLCADPIKREVFVSRGAVELVWCASFGHLVFYERLIQGKIIDKPIDPQSDPIVRNALQLMQWSIKCQLTGNNSDDWPQYLPRPLEMPTAGTYEEFADELCLVSWAFLLHHELAHIRNHHTADENEDWSLDQEKEADIAAAEWILDAIAHSDKRFVKRMLGIVQANLIATAIGLHQCNLGGQTHPFSYDRLTTLIDRFSERKNQDVKAFAFAVLALHMENTGRHLKRSTFTDFAEALNAVCDQLAEEFARQGNH